MVDYQELTVGLDLRNARGKVKEEAGVVGENEARRNRHLRVDKIGEAAIDAHTYQRVDQLRAFQKRALHVQQCSTIPALGQSTHFFRDRPACGAGQTKIADDHDVICKARHRDPARAAISPNRVSIHVEPF